MMDFPIDVLLEIWAYWKLSVVWQRSFILLNRARYYKWTIVQILFYVTKESYATVCKISMTLQNAMFDLPYWTTYCPDLCSKNGTISQWNRSAPKKFKVNCSVSVGNSSSFPDAWSELFDSYMCCFIQHAPYAPRTTSWIFIQKVRTCPTETRSRMRHRRR
jgi:hypothetical protein